MYLRELVEDVLAFDSDQQISFSCEPEKVFIFQKTFVESTLKVGSVLRKCSIAFWASSASANPTYQVANDSAEVASSARMTFDSF